jgi:hypothetical protein
MAILAAAIMMVIAAIAVLGGLTRLHRATAGPQRRPLTVSLTPVLFSIAMVGSHDRWRAGLGAHAAGLPSFAGRTDAIRFSDPSRVGGPIGDRAMYLAAGTPDTVRFPLGHRR